MRTPGTSELVAWDTGGMSSGQCRGYHGRQPGPGQAGSLWGETEQDVFTHECTLTSWHPSHPGARLAGSLRDGPKEGKAMRTSFSIEYLLMQRLRRARRPSPWRRQASAQVWRWEWAIVQGAGGEASKGWKWRWVHPSLWAAP